LQNKAPWQGYVCLAASMGLVGSYVALSKPLAAVFPVFLLALLRFSIGALAMPHWLQKPVTEAPLNFQTKRLLFIESFLGNFLFSICMLYGVSMTSAVAAGVIMASIPAACALLSWLFLRERVTPRVWWAVALAVGGIALVSLQRAPSATANNASLLGNALLCAAVLCEAAYAVIGKRLTASLGPRRISALINLWGLVLMLPFGIAAGWNFSFSQVSAPSWALLIFYGLAASVWTVWLWMTGLRHVPASQAGVFTAVLPISAALVGVLFLGETVSALQWLAFGLALAGVFLATLTTNSPSK
jgi:drug/metabolite transporter (DMT)-like permease